MQLPLLEQARAFLRGRAGAYRRVLGNPQNRDVETVLVDLARFCRAHASTAAIGRDGKFDPLMAARLDGRREVWLRLEHHLRLDTDTLWLLYGGQPQPQQKVNDDD